MNVPRLLPLVGVAVGGVLAVKLLSGVSSFPELFDGAKAFAEGKPAAAAKAAENASTSAKATADKPVLPPGLSPAQAAAAGDVGVNASAAQARPRLACTPNATDLAREAGLSPSELQVLQSLGTRRGQLDQREADLQVQLQLLAAAEGKVDAKLNALANMKKDLQGLLDRADQQSNAELDRLVAVYAAMKPRDAAQRLALLDDAVRIPIAAKMKERALSAILGQMSPADAKTITEKLARRFQSQALNDAKAAINGSGPVAAAATPAQPTQQAAATPADAQAATPDAAQPAKEAPKKVAAAKKPRRAKAKPTKLASAAAPPDKPQPYKAPATAPSSTPAAATPAASPAKAG